MLTLWNESLWGDEGFSAMAVMKSFSEMMAVVLKDTAPPGFYLIGWSWGRLVGFSEIALRGLSMLLMLGAAGFAGLIVYHLTKRKLLAILTLLLAFLSPFSFQFAFEWRMYALLTFATLGSMYFFVARKWKGYVVMTALALYTHHFGLFTLAGQGLWYLITEFPGLKRDWNKPKRLFKHLWPFGAVVLAYAPWFYPMYLQTTRVQGAGFWLKVPTFPELTNLMYRFMTGGVREDWRLTVAVLVGVLVLGKNWKKIGRKWLEILVVVVIAPVLIAYAVSHLVTPIFYDRYLLSVLMGVAVLAALSIKRWLVPVLVVLVLMYGFESYRLFINPTKKPFRDFALLVKQELREGDKLVNYNGKAHHIWETQYYGIGAPIYTPDGPLPLWVGTAQMKPEDTIETLPEAKRLGLITSEEVEAIKLPEEWKKTKVTELGGMRAVWFERKQE